MEKQPICDMRVIYRSEDGAYTSNRVLCDYCGAVPTCTIKGVIRRCEMFAPTLGFGDKTGIFDVFSTFRLGKAWSERIRKGAAVALFDLRKKEVFGHATVVEVIHGNKLSLMKEHADTNHMMLLKAYESHDAMVEKFEKLLRRLYGNMIYNYYDDATVIYLKRIKQQEAQ